MESHDTPDALDALSLPALLALSREPLPANAATLRVAVIGHFTTDFVVRLMRLYLSRLGGALAALGRAILAAAPWMMKTLSVVGTAAMFLVGGGILVHGLPVLHHLIEPLTSAVSGWSSLILATAAEGLVGIVAGGLVLAAVTLGQKVFRRA